MTFADTREIYNRMQDEISQKLFAARLSVSATGNAGYLTMLPRSEEHTSELQSLA